jgi:CrcB protein
MAVRHGVKNYLLVFAGGGLGAAARYWLSAVVYRWLPSDFPYGNLLVNVSGCFIIGLLASALEERFIVDPSLRVFLTIGILGGFTTFSSFSYEAISLLRDASYLPALWYVVGTVAGCLAATIAGLMVGRLI